MKKVTTLEQTKELSRQVTDGIAQVAEAAAGALDEMDKSKADKKIYASATIPTAGWVASGITQYPFQYDLAARSVRAEDRVAVYIAPESMDTAIGCGLCPTNESLTRKLRFYSVKAPEKAINIEYAIEIETEG